MTYVIEAKSNFETFRKMKSLYRFVKYDNGRLYIKADYPDTVANLVSLLNAFSSDGIRIKNI